jgi:hypothetical protein
MTVSNESAVATSPEQASGYNLEWVAPFPIWRNRVVIQQLALVFVIPLVILSVILALILWPRDSETLVFLGEIVLITAGVFLILLLIGVAVVSAGGSEMEYRLNEQGIGGRPYGRTAKKNTVINTLLVFSGRPTAMGAGVLAQSRQVEYTAWKDVHRVETDPKRRTIALYKGRWPVMVVACDDAHYEAVLHQARSAVARQQRERR